MFWIFPILHVPLLLLGSTGVEESSSRVTSGKLQSAQFYLPVRSFVWHFNLTFDWKASKVGLRCIHCMTGWTGHVCRFLNEVQSHSSSNKMTVQNLATVFGPNILRAKAEDPQSIMGGDYLPHLLYKRCICMLLVSKWQSGSSLETPVQEETYSDTWMNTNYEFDFLKKSLSRNTGKFLFYYNCSVTSWYVWAFI